MFYVYILFSESFNRYYIGMTERINERLLEHNTGKMQSTKPYVPWKLVYHELFGNRKEARDREKYFKSAAGRRWRKKNIMAP
ncbi:MAG: GIY-YIG nuclease family protein [Flavobacteriaceae bacterium]|nr:GIY-YIG nuclease family protein [Flavobacteriaceae bacterium]